MHAFSILFHTTEMYFLGGLEYFFLAKFSVSLEIISEEQLHTYTLPSYSQLSDNNIFLLDGPPADTNGATNSTSSRIESQIWVLSRS